MGTPGEQLTRSLLNILSFSTAIGVFLIFLISYFIYEDGVYASLCMGAFLFFGLIPVLHHFDQAKLAKFHFAVIIPIWVFTKIIVVGGYFSQSLIITVCITMVYLLFKNSPKLRTLFILYAIALYIVPTLYVNFGLPISGLREHPVDEILIFLLCLGWIFAIFLIHEDEAGKYIETLELKNKALEKKTAELERFTYIASHDLKLPIRNIISFLNLIRREIDRSNYESLPEYLEFAETGAYQLNELVEGVLEFTQIDKAESQNYKLVDLNKALQKVLLNLQPEITEKQANIYFETLPHIKCNEHDFVIIFQNLLQNGLKYNRSLNPTVKISFSSNNNWDTIAFTDNGIGIKKEYYNQIFEMFKRLHNYKDYPGTGIGLGLCKKLIEKYKGQIGIDSEPGKYSTFSIMLPKLRAEVNA